jgi:predicted transcriptional regulator
MAVGFLDDFFQGSPSSLLMSLLGSKRISKEDADSLKRLIENNSAAPSRKKGTRHDERT